MAKGIDGSRAATAYNVFGGGITERAPSTSVQTLTIVFVP